MTTLSSFKKSKKYASKQSTYTSKDKNLHKTYVN